jgi:branched-chain amino acid transport system substrate-binding protein
MQQRAIEMWRDEVNARGGILGNPVEIVVRDDRSDPQIAMGIYTDFVTDPSIDHVLAPYSSQLTGAVAPIVEKAGFPMLASGAAADDLWRHGYANLFGILTPASRYTQGILRLAREVHLGSLALLYADDPLSEEIAQGTRKWAPYLKLRLALDRRFSRDMSDLPALLREARAAGAELVIVAGYLNEAKAARRALRDLQWEPRAFFATIGPAFPEWSKLFPEPTENTFAISVWEPTDSIVYPRSRAFAAAFRARYGLEPSYHAAAAYSAGEILETALTAAKSTDRGAVRAALANLDTYTVLGRYAVDRTGIQVKRFDFLIQWQSGRKQIVWPEELRTATPIIGPAQP